ncbi:MAG: alpha/beta hydrolase [Labedaea sp.]
MSRRLRRTLSLFVAAGLAVVAPGVAVPAAVSATPVVVVCSMITTRVSSVDGGPVDLKMGGTLCRPDFAPMPHTVLLLVHGATYTRQVWDWPQNPSTYSFVQDAVNAGYATFAVDRLGHGESTHTAAGGLTIQSGTTALHGVVTQLRNGTIGGSPFGKVVWVGHSLGAVHGYDYGGRYSDISAFAFAGSAHAMKQSWLNLIISSLQPADPTSGYLTTVPGSRAALYYNTATADPAVIAQDEVWKDTITYAEVNTALPLVTGPAAGSPTQGITVPVLIAMGQFDNLVCGGSDGMTCTTTSVRNLELPYFTHAPSVTAQVTAGSGHMLSQHPSAPVAHSAMLTWIRGIALP